MCSSSTNFTGMGFVHHSTISLRRKASLLPVRNAKVL
jgi:hypothetical protein